MRYRPAWHQWMRKPWLRRESLSSFSLLLLTHAALLQTWSNLADTLVSQAELLEQQGMADARMASMYTEAMAAYGKACMLSSSEEGDDLPGLLNNWGVGLHFQGIHTKVHSQTSVSGRGSVALGSAWLSGKACMLSCITGNNDLCALPRA